MEFKNFYTKTFYYESKEIKKYSSMSEPVKKRKEKTQKGIKVINAISDLVYLKFHFKGKLLALYNEKPTQSNIEKPFQIIYLRQINKIITKIEGKPGFFQLQIGKYKWELKCNNKNKWVKAISFFGKNYGKDKDFITREYGDKLDLRLINRIKAENDVLSWKNKWENFDYKNFITDKDLLLLFDLNIAAVLKNRLLIAKIEEKTIIRTDRHKSALIYVQKKKKKNKKKKNLSITDLSEEKEFHIVMLSPIPLSKIDEIFYREDLDILKKANIVPWMDFNIIYFFNYVEKGDDSSYYKAFSVMDIENVILIEDGKKLKIQIKDRVLEIGFRTHFESFLWLNGIKVAMNYNLLKERSSVKKVFYNIDLLYEYLNYNRKTDIKKILMGVIKNLDSDNNIDGFFSSLKIVNAAVNNFIDSFYARVPFNSSFFVYCIFTFHSKIRFESNEFWNKNYEEINALQAIEFANIIFHYLKMLEKWKITDNYFINWEVPLINTFITKLYEKIKEILFNIILEVQDNFQIVDDKILNNSSDMLQSQLNFIFDHYKKVSNNKTAVILIEACSNLFTTFLRYLLEFLTKTKEIIETEIYMAIINNEYLIVVKNFIKKVYRDTQKKMKKNKIKMIFKEKTIIKLIVLVGEICLENLKRDILVNMEKKFRFKNFVDLDFEMFLKNNLKDFKVLEMRLSENNSGIFYIEFLNKMIFVYFACFIHYCPNISTKDFLILQDKIPKDKDLFLNKLTISEEEKNELIFKFDTLLSLLETQDIDEVIVNIMNMQLFYSSLINEDNIKKIVQCKIFFPTDSKIHITNYLKKALEKDRKQKLAKKGLGKHFFVIFLVFRFVRILKANYKRRKRIVRNLEDSEIKVIKTQDSNKKEEKKRIKNKKKELLKYDLLNPSYESIYQTQGWVEIYKFEHKNNSQSQLEKYFKEKLTNKKIWKKKYIFFNVGALSVCETSTHDEIILNILYSQIRGLKSLGKNSIFFKQKKTGFVFNFKNTNLELKNVFFDNLNILKISYGKKSVDFVEMDVTEYFDILKWKYTKPNYGFDFEYFKALDEAKLVVIEFESDDDLD